MSNTKILQLIDHYQNCATVDELIRYLKADIEQQYEEDDAQSVRKFFRFFEDSPLSIDADLSPTAKKRIRDEAHQIAQWRGYTVSRDLPEDEILRTRARLTILEVKQLMVEQRLERLQGTGGETLFDYD